MTQEQKLYTKSINTKQPNQNHINSKFFKKYQHTNTNIRIAHCLVKSKRFINPYKIQEKQQIKFKSIIVL